jgi:hypothetical protein
MRSRAARLFIATIACIALGAATFFLIQSEQEIRSRQTALSAFDIRAREASDALAEARAGQQAYVAAGQGLDFWMPRVAAVVDRAASLVDTLRASAAAGRARASLMEAAASITELGNVDRRARDYLRSDQQFMAADVVFTEGVETAGVAARQVEVARLAEHEYLDSWETRTRWRQAYILAASGGLAVFLIVTFAWIPGVPRVKEPVRAAAEEPAAAKAAASNEVLAREKIPRHTAPALKEAAELCTDLARVTRVDDLTTLLGKAAAVMDASGLIVWLGSPTGADLRAVAAHGYSPQTLTHMPAVPRSADNAAAAAYRTGALQIVLSRPGVSNGAIAAPLLSSEGCVGALTAEIKGRSETSDAVQALTAIVAAQLASLLAASAAACAEAAEGKIASAVQ